MRQQLIFGHPSSPYRSELIDEEADFLASQGIEPLTAFVNKVTPGADSTRRRELNARIIALLAESGRSTEAIARGFELLRANHGDDAADRVSRALDRPAIVRGLDRNQRALLGETFQSHRHYDRAIALLSSALTAAPPPTPQQRDALRFAIGRCHFGAERYEEAHKTYLDGAGATADARMKATFFFHASRAAQLRGDDAGAERLMTSAIAVKGKFPATTAALTQRLRTRAKARRFADAASDLALLKRLAPNDRAILEGSLAYALGMLGAGNHAAALSTLNTIPRNLMDPYDRAEIAYWRARALEQSDMPAAFAAYLSVLRSTVPTHFAYFARERLDSPQLASRVDQELRVRESQVIKLIAEKKFDLARRIETDRVLLSQKNHAAELQRLRSVYEEIPAYRAVLQLAPRPTPAFPAVDPSDRDSLLMAMGLFDETVDEITDRWPLRPMESALTQAATLNAGGASRQSIYAVEVLMKSVPEDFVPELLPPLVRQLLYPRYFYSFIEADARRYGSDPALVVSIMREESRFNPRAKSQAAARGLLQFIITTARDIGRDVGLVDVDPEDLYDPRVIIRLGAKYVSELSETFDGDRYRAVAAYNAGPNQVALWSRIAPAPGADYFLSSINFDETKHYVRKVMNSYKRYGEIYGQSGPVGGLRAEP